MKTTQAESFQPDIMRYEGIYPVLSGDRISLPAGTVVEVEIDGPDALCKVDVEGATLRAYIPKTRLSSVEDKKQQRGKAEE